MDKLQLSLIGLGSLGLIGLFGYSKWQEVRARRHAENVFGAEHRDVLLDDAVDAAALADSERSEPTAATDERVEPVVGVTPEHKNDTPDCPQFPEFSDTSAVKPTVLNAATMQLAGNESVDDEMEAAPLLEQAESLPREVNEHVDCVMRVEPARPLTGAQVMAACAQVWPQPVAGVRWFGLPSGSASWRSVSAGTGGQYIRVVGALQLASRAGAVGEADLMALANGARGFGERLSASVTVTDARLAAAQAAELDRFCASVDVLIGVNVIAHEQPFPGTKIRGLAEAAGMKLGSDGMYRAFDEEGGEMFCLANLDNIRLTSDSLRTLQSRGLTLMLDVPRAANGKVAFERMLLLARQLAEALRGRLVDDNQAPLADAALNVIREQIGKFQKQMAERSIPAGSPVALRVFS